MSIRIDRTFRFHFVRHGVTELNFRGLRCGGDLDPPLTEVGCDQAFLLGKQIARMDLAIDRIIAADLVRTRQTAMIVSGVLGAVAIEVEPSMNERRLGAWNEQPIADTEPLLREGVTPPGGESEAAFAARVTLAFERLRPHLDRHVLVVSSRGVARMLNTVLGGGGRLAVANGEVVEFAACRNSDGKFAVEVRKPLQIG